MKLEIVINQTLQKSIETLWNLNQESNTKTPILLIPENESKYFFTINTKTKKFFFIEKQINQGDDKVFETIEDYSYNKKEFDDLIMNYIRDHFSKIVLKENTLIDLCQNFKYYIHEFFEQSDLSNFSYKKYENLPSLSGFTEKFYNHIIKNTLYKNGKTIPKRIFEDFDKNDQTKILKKIEEYRNTNNHLQKIGDFFGVSFTLRQDINNIYSFYIRTQTDKKIEKLIDTLIQKTHNPSEALFYTKNGLIEKNQKQYIGFKINSNPKILTAHEKIKIKQYFQSVYNISFDL